MTKRLTEEEKAKHTAARRKAELLVRSQRNHVPGSGHTVAGTSYVVMPNGSWLRVTKKPHEKSEVFLVHLEAARTKFPSAKVGV